MDEQLNREPRRNPRRRPRPSQAQIIKQNYLPFLIAAVALILIIVFIAGSISRAARVREAEAAASIAASQAAAAEELRLSQEAAFILSEAEELAACYDYRAAVALMDTFSGDISKFPSLQEKYNAYRAAMETVVAWTDPGQVVNLSFLSLISDPARAFSDNENGRTYNRDHVTCDEFYRILRQLYENGYVLVGLEDIVQLVADPDGASRFQAKTLYLPEGKKPLMLTHTNINFFTSMVDGDGDGVADKDGDGFASKLVLDENGDITAEMVDAEGNTIYGDYDFVTILNSFVAENPDFSYNGAKAILAPSGYDGLFGYRTNPGAKDRLGEEAYAKEVEAATQIAQALGEDGYVLACGTYGNVGYGSLGSAQLQSDLDKWAAEVTPILGQTDILVYAKRSDIAQAGEYSGEKFQALQNAGFRYYLGFCSDGGIWTSGYDDYFRQGRILVTGSALGHHEAWFEGMFKTVSVLDPTRGTIPE